MPHREIPEAAVVRQDDSIELNSGELTTRGIRMLASPLLPPHPLQALVRSAVQDYRGGSRACTTRCPSRAQPISGGASCGLAVVCPPALYVTGVRRLHCWSDRQTVKDPPQWAGCNGGTAAHQQRGGVTCLRRPSDSSRWSANFGSVPGPAHSRSPCR